MNLHFTHTPPKPRKPGEEPKPEKAFPWKATADTLPLPGAGITQADAMDSLVRANYAALGIESITVDDPTKLNPCTQWTREKAAALVEALKGESNATHSD